MPGVRIPRPPQNQLFMAKKKKADQNQSYTEDDIQSLDWKDHIRRRPGMYIGKKGNGAYPDDGIYILIKETIDNSIDEFVMGNGKRIDVTVDGKEVTVRDRGRGIPFGKIVDCVSKINTGAKYDSSAFKKSVGLNGVGTKAVNALSSYFEVESVRDGKKRKITFEKGVLKNNGKSKDTKESNGTKIKFVPDEEVFGDYKYRHEYIEELLQNYCYLNRGLNIYLNGTRYYSKNGLSDLLQDRLSHEPLYSIVHLEGKDVEVAFTHTEEHGEEYYTFVNGQHTTQGGSHLKAFREAIGKAVKEFYGKDFEPADVRKSLVAAVSVKIVDPVFESQTKTKLGSTKMDPEGTTIRSYIIDFLTKKLDNYLRQNKETSDVLLDKVKRSEKERKELAGIKKLAKQRAKQASVHNKKLKDCKLHLNDNKGKEGEKDSTIFLTEGDSASGSITKARDVNTQAVFSLKGKPVNVYGSSKKVVYENEELNLIQSALNIEDGLDGLRYNNIIMATDADVDGMHIRLLLLTFFLQFFPELVKRGHIQVLETPLYRVRNKNTTHYCYTEKEMERSVKKLKGNPEITRFKGLGEISPDEFKKFIQPENIRTFPIYISENDDVEKILSFYMGKNTTGRKDFIMNNMRVDA